MAPSFAPLPSHLVPLIGGAVDRAYATLERVLPHQAPHNALEDAMWEPSVPVGSMTAAQALELELSHGALERARIFRPRLVIHGKSGLGQRAVCAALLHRIERLHVQTLSVSTLLGDSSQSPEAALIQQCTEARRLRPSVLYVPELDRWPLLLSESVRRTFGALLDSFSGDDAVMLIGSCETPLSELPDDMRQWFGWLPVHVELDYPATEARATFFADIAHLAARPPTGFADALPKRRRVLEELPVAPPRPPRQLTDHELRMQEANDARLLEHLKFRIGPVLGELRKKFKKFTRDVWEEYKLRELMEQFDWKREKGKVIVTLRYEKDDPDDDADDDAEDQEQESVPDNSEIDGGAQEQNHREIRNEDGDSTSQQGHPVDKQVDIAPETASPAEYPAEDTHGTAMQTENDAQTDTHVEEHESQSITESGGTSEPTNSAVDKAPASASRAISDDQDKNAAPQETGLGVPGATDTAAALTRVAPETKRGLREDPQDPRYLLRDLEIFTMTLEKMQRRLYYNEYLTCDAFMDDLDKIVANAEAAKEVDADRLFRAHQMRNLAVILLDQYIDASFREECARMAQRVAQRSAQAAEQRVTEQHPGQRYSARIMGQSAEPMVDVSIIERTHKRARSTSTYNVEHKRARTEGEAGTETQTEPEVQEPPPPPPSNDPLLSAEAQRQLADSLSSLTSGFTVEQLEQVRAACVERVLAHRSSWDRAALVSELHDLVHGVRATIGVNLHDTR